MTELIMAGTVLAAVGIVCFTTLRGWRAWLELRRFELTQRNGGFEPAPAARIEVADLKERVRSLEALARGVDL